MNQSGRRFTIISLATLLALIGSLFSPLLPTALADNGPIEILNWHHLNEVRENLSGSYILGNDLDENTAGYDEHAGPDANDGAGWEPIGTLGDRFTGNLDGQEYTISGLFINRPTTDYVGLFGYVDGGEVKNVGLLDVNVTGDNRVGGLVGSIHDDGMVSNSYSTGEVSGTGSVGGLVGGTSGWDTTTVDSSYSSGSVTGDSNVGGLAGYVRDRSISRSYSTSDVSGNDRVGGFVGNAWDGRFYDSYATGDVTRTNGAGENVGGFLGYDFSNSRIERCYSTGSVYYANDDDPADKGFAGSTVFITWDSFFDRDASNQDTDAAGAADPKTTAEMKDITTFSDAGWDIETTSAADHADGYPFLSWQLEGSPVWYIHEAPFAWRIRLRRRPLPDRELAALSQY